MANVTGRNGIKERKDSLYVKVEEFVPPSGWTEDSNCHFLLVDLPGFKREEVKLEVDYSDRHLTVSGERLVSDNKFSCFKETYKLPENSDIENISGKFEGELLHVTVPKQVIEKDEELVNENYGNPEAIHEEENEHDNGTAHGIEEENVQEKPKNKEDSSKDNEKHDSGHGCLLEKKEKSQKSAEREGFYEDSRDKWGQEDSLMDSLMKKLNKNKGIALIVVLAFSLGVWVSRKSESIGQERAPFN